MADSEQKGQRHSTGRVSGNGVVLRRSVYSFADTVRRLEQAARAHGAQLFGRIDHAANAKRVGLAIEPMELLLIGRPEASTPLIRSRPTAGLDLPLKVLVWREGNDVWIAYNDIGYIALRHGATDIPDAVAAMYAWFEPLVVAGTDEPVVLD